MKPRLTATLVNVSLLAEFDPALLVGQAINITCQKGGVQFADALDIFDVKGYNLRRTSCSVSYLLIEGGK